MEARGEAWRASSSGASRANRSSAESKRARICSGGTCALRRAASSTARGTQSNRVTIAETISGSSAESGACCANSSMA